MASETKSTVVKVKPISQDGGSSSSKPKVDSSLIKKKAFESSTKRIVVDSKSRSTSTPIKTEVKGKTTLSSSKMTTKTPTVKTREKKAYSLAGQKFDVPEEREPLRIFYESLLKQIPSSEMAEFWMMEHGLLSPDKARKAYEKKQIRQKQHRTGTPIKSPPPRPPSKPETSKKQQQTVSKNGEVKAKKRIIESDDDDDFILSPKRRKG
ncbi:hypothetical protein RHMOL_Rhmol07G0188300 [Rhododendron molle]|uniref:Uncharacterized protein n=1 Tax=Rhododendron molle TaxID=49168 RepID=A0ACC0N266_RHOML|nr:hypothetical protein RHMOL_Rhmol07G0188300 [Rhododendron molle]